MGSLITLGAGGNEYQVSAPQYGYTCEVVNPYHFQRKKIAGYSSYDDGSVYDYRIFNGNFLFDSTDASEFIGVYRDLDKGRGVSVGIRLPENSGFTPFGPDKGDYGNYIVTITDIIPTGALVRPYKYFSINCTLIASSYPSVSAPTVKTDGNFQVGSITGLRFPDNFPQISNHYDINVRTTRDGTCHQLAQLSNNDNYDTMLKMICCRSRAYALLNYLTATARTTSLNIVAQDGTYLFGLENEAGGTYTCKWIDKSVIITHTLFDRYEFDLNFNLVEII